ncbi:hypothetical protein RJT34_19874 [Clitoria ternatea]|uniref:Uncharacterized protein n=1 Tax=Clitoria ternatea TaxID=43366 RepID=A0AAN9ISA2_CLITE
MMRRDIVMLIGCLYNLHLTTVELLSGGYFAGHIVYYQLVISFSFCGKHLDLGIKLSTDAPDSASVAVRGDDNRDTERD